MARQQQLTMVACGLLAIGMVKWWALPLWDRLTELERQVASTQEQLGRLQELASRQALIDQHYHTYETFRSAKPRQLLQAAFLNELEQLAQEADLHVNLRPRPMQRDGPLIRLKVEVEVDATQEALLAFLDRLLTAQQLVELDRLRISSTISKDRPLRVGLVIAKVILNPSP